MTLLGFFRSELPGYCLNFSLAKLSQIFRRDEFGSPRSTGATLKGWRYKTLVDGLFGHGEFAGRCLHRGQGRANPALPYMNSVDGRENRAARASG